MKKKSLVYSDLSKKQLENLKEFAFKKVESISRTQAICKEIISHQIKILLIKKKKWKHGEKCQNFLRPI